jgi:hypothetical protein
MRVAVPRSLPFIFLAYALSLIVKIPFIGDQVHELLSGKICDR